MHLTRSSRYRWVVAGIAFLAVFGAVGLGRQGYSAILPSMQAALDLSDAAAGSLFSWNLAGYTLMALVGGMLASRFGPSKVIVVGLLIAAAALFGTGLADDLLWLSIGRLVTGMATGMVLAPAIVLMSAWFRAGRVGVASGIIPAGSSFGMLVTGAAVPRIIAHGGDDGWRLAWYSFAGVTITMAVLALVALRDRPSGGGGSTERGRRVDRGDYAAVVQSRYTWHLGGVYLLQGFAIAIYFTFFQKRLIADLGYSSEVAGALFLIIGVAGLISGVMWGAISDRLGRGKAMAGMFLLDAIAAGLFALWPNPIVLGISAFILGACGSGIAGLVGAACFDSSGPVLASASLGFVTIFTGVGQALGPYVGGLLGDAFSSLVPSYLLAALLFLLDVFLALRLRDVRGMSGPRAAEACQPPALPS